MKTKEDYLLLVGGDVEHLSALDDGPLVPLDVVNKDSEEAKHGQGLHPHLLPHVMLWGGGPHQEGGDILGHLGHGGGGTILVLNDVIV